MVYANNKKWRIRDLASVYIGFKKSGVRNWQFKTSGVKLLNVSNITTTNTIDLKKSSIYLSEDEVEKIYSHFLLDEGDLVIASSGISFDIDKLLRTKIAFVSQKHLPLCLNTSTMRFKSKDENIAILNFLRYWLESEPFRVQITKLVTGSAQQNFGSSHLKQLQISLPTVGEQRRIAAILDKADRLRANAVLPKLFRSLFSNRLYPNMFGDLVSNR
jgi:type I restriction enzyme S subunit